MRDSKTSIVLCPPEFLLKIVSPSQELTSAPFSYQNWNCSVDKAADLSLSFENPGFTGNASPKLGSGGVEAYASSSRVSERDFEVLEGDFGDDTDFGGEGGGDVDWVCKCGGDGECSCLSGEFIAFAALSANKDHPPSNFVANLGAWLSWERDAVLGRVMVT
eukprot:g44992.t1